MMRRVLVGSNNAVKVAAVEAAQRAVWPDITDWLVEGISVESGVSEQPLDELETITGARNRANRLREQAEAEFYVGIEGGLVHAAGWWMECGWVVLISKFGEEGIASSPRMMIPDKIYQFLQTGKTLNDACSTFLNVENAGDQMGYFGIMTNGAVDRQRAYVDAICCALARFTRYWLFEEA
jgi:inosine/xanthosine triphosphatase